MDNGDIEGVEDEFGGAHSGRKYRPVVSHDRAVLEMSSLESGSSSSLPVPQSPFTYGLSIYTLFFFLFLHWFPGFVWSSVCWWGKRRKDILSQNEFESRIFFCLKNLAPVRRIGSSVLLFVDRGITICLWVWISLLRKCLLWETKKDKENKALKFFYLFICIRFEFILFFFHVRELRRKEWLISSLFFIFNLSFVFMR